MVITGSQIPLVEGRNDGIDNLLGAITLAGHFDLPEVCLFFHNKLFRGVRSTKADASALDAFASPNHPPLAVCNIEINVAWNSIFRQTAIQKDRQASRQTGRQADRHTETYRQIDRQKHSKTDRRTDGRIDRQTDRQPDRETDRRTDRCEMTQNCRELT